MKEKQLFRPDPMKRYQDPRVVSPAKIAAREQLRREADEARVNILRQMVKKGTIEREVAESLLAAAEQNRMAKERGKRR